MDADNPKTGWTVLTSHAHLLRLLEEMEKRLDHRFNCIDEKLILQDRAVQTAFNSAEKAVRETKDTTEKRLEGMNEFRAALGDQTRMLLPRNEADQRFQSIAEKIDFLKQAQAELAGSRHQGEASGVKVMWAIGISLSVLLSIAALVIEIALRRGGP